MPRGRHRHSPPLHRLLPPSTVAGASIACAAGAWFVGDDLVQRVLAAGAAAAAIGGAVLLRTWDRKAGKRVAELTRARVRDEWRTEERIAELETDVEESREIRTGLDAKLRAKRAELARLRSEHAELLRRYATAETERASALEGRRLLAIEAAVPARALAAAAERRPATTPPASASPSSSSPSSSVPAPASAPSPAPAMYAQADQALRRLARNAARQRNGGRDGAARREGARDGEDRRGNSEAAVTSALRRVPAAAAAVAPHRPAASRMLGGFDFFGNAASVPPRQLTAPLEDDLADVVGDEALAEHSAHAGARLTAPAGATAGEPAAGDTGAGAAAGGDVADAQAADGQAGDRTAPGRKGPDGATTDGVGEVIDLTVHDETEQLDLAALRTAIS
ncbi:hypothetical protein ACIRPT_14725 [Streptomyces sp. NPDC101227]|uniref:hypothetical protein n=1 Tax=Streptomyces sp. NPDC101227 TaxID=3366136 RepID=UPI003814FEE3